MLTLYGINFNFYIRLMSYLYTPELISSALTYSDYRKQIDETLALPPQNETAEKMRPHFINNAALMEQYDNSYHASAGLLDAIKAAPATTWLVITEGWCGDAAFNVPMFNIIEKAVPGKVKLRLLLRDTNLDVMDANLTDGGRSIPKLIVLNNNLQELGKWGPRPAGLQILMKTWKNEGLELKELIPKVHGWYNADDTATLQEELKNLAQGYSLS
jgi:hypothetical protein